MNDFRVEFRDGTILTVKADSVCFFENSGNASFYEQKGSISRQVEMYVNVKQVTRIQ